MATMLEFMREITELLRGEEAEPVGQVELTLPEVCGTCKFCQKFGPVGIGGESFLDLYVCGLKGGPLWPAADPWIGFLIKCSRYEYDGDEKFDEDLREKIRLFAGIDSTL